MLRRDLFRFLMATRLAGWLRPWGPFLSGGAASGGLNAADVYRKAFGWVEGLRPEESEMLREAATIAIDDERIAALIHQVRPVLKAIREAALIDECRWGTAAVTSDELGKGHLNACNLKVIYAACLSARGHAKSGKGRDAVNDAFAGLTLAHRIGTGGCVLARVLEGGGETRVFQTLGRILPALEPAALDDLSQRLSVLPPPEPASAAIGPESRFILGEFRTKLAATGPVVGDAEWVELGFDDEEAMALKRLTGGDRAKLLTHFDATVPAFAELARRLDLPRPGCRAALEEFASAEQSTYPIAAGLVGSAWDVRHVVDRMRAMRSVLHAGITLVRDGERPFRAESDPFGTGAFGLERRGRGYLIRSALDDEGRPGVSLEIGEPDSR